MNYKELSELREKLFDNGYTPVPLVGKSPEAMEDWRNKCLSADKGTVSNWSFLLPNASNTGVLTGEVVVIDIDVLDEAKASGLRELAVSTFGPTPLVRIGKAPKVALFYRTTEAFRKKMIPLQLEVMADGQQVVVFGIHPDTQQPYRWEGATPLDVPVAELPVLDEARCEAYILAARDYLGLPASAGPQGGRQPPNEPVGERDNVVHLDGGNRAKRLKRALSVPLTDLMTTQTGDRNNKLFKVACYFGQYVAGGEIEEAVAVEQLKRACQANGLWAEDPDAAFQTIQSGLERGGREPKEVSSNWTQDQIAMEFVKSHGDQFMFNHSTGQWLKWEGSHWAVDETEQHFDAVRKFCQSFNKEHGDKLGSVDFWIAVVRALRSMPEIAVTNAKLDQDEWLLATPAATIDLQTGQHRDAFPEDMITACTTVDCRKGDHPKWSAFLEEATKGDKDLQRFLQQIAGYALSGSTMEQCLFFVYGKGGNGKSVFINVLQGILGETYCATPPMETFVDGFGSKHTTDIAMLYKARLVSMSETDEGRTWAEAKIKQLTGKDKITARFMRKDNFSFSPKFKILIAGNNKPQLKVVDDAIKRRFNIIPFLNKPKVVNKNLEEELKEEWPAILSWMVEGCLDWQKNGLVRPQCVLDATAEYMAEQDLMGQWIEQECVIDPNAKCHSNDLYKSYSAFYEDMGKHAPDTVKFAERLRKVDGVEYRPQVQIGGERKRGWVGIALKKTKGGKGGSGWGSMCA